MGRNKLSLASCLILLVLVGLTMGLSSCGGGGGSRPVTKPGDEVIITPPENHAPIILQTLEDITPPPSSGAFRWESKALTEYFSDPDGDTLRFSAQTNNPDVSSVEVSETDVLIVRVSEPATARISVTATDPRGASATQHFSVTLTGTEPTEEPPPADHSDTQVGALQIAPGQTVRGEFHSADDVDWLRLELPKPGLVELQFDAPTGAEITVFDQDGNVLASGRTQSRITITVPTRVRNLIRLLTKTPIKEAITWLLKVKAAKYLEPRIHPITVRAGLDAEITKDNIKCGLIWADNGSDAGFFPEACEVMVTEIEVPSHGRKVYRAGETAAIASMKNGAIFIDTLCPAPPGETSTYAHIRMEGYRFSAFKIPVLELPRSVVFPVSIGITIDDADDKTCRPKVRNSEAPDGPELPTSISIAPGESAWIDLTDYIYDPRREEIITDPWKRELDFSASEDSEDIVTEIDGGQLTIRATSDAEGGQTTIKITATSTRHNYPLKSEFTLPVYVSTECRVLSAGVGPLTRWPYYYALAANILTEFEISHGDGRWVYAGECSDGFASGQGELSGRGELSEVRPTGDYEAYESLSYNGGWERGKPHGVGTLRTGVTFDTELRRTEIAAVYHGSWRNGRPLGNGSLTITNIYSKQLNCGLFHHDVIRSTRNAQCTKSETSYSGTWADGVVDGRGTLRSANNAGEQFSYEGGFSRGQYHGRGTLTGSNSRGESLHMPGEWRRGGFWNGTATIVVEQHYAGLDRVDLLKYYDVYINGTLCKRFTDDSVRYQNPIPSCK